MRRNEQAAKQSDWTKKKLKQKTKKKHKKKVYIFWSRTTQMQGCFSVGTSSRVDVKSGMSKKQSYRFFFKYFFLN
jgi:hypothetical protein